MKTMCPPGYHRNGFMETDKLRCMMYILSLDVSLTWCIYITYDHLYIYRERDR